MAAAAGLSLLLPAFSAPAAGPMTIYSARSGSKMRMEGTSSMHDWQVESKFIGGFLEVGPGFPTEPGQKVTPGKVEAGGQVFVIVTSLKSLEKDGRPYSDAMDNVMSEHLKGGKYPRITYHLEELVLKEAPKDKDAPYLFDSKGELCVAGVTNTISMPVEVTVMPDKKLKITGATGLKLSQFKIDPPGLAFAIKVGDDVKVIFTWILAPKPAAAAAGK
jgi:hypothetical protein